MSGDTVLVGAVAYHPRIGLDPVAVDTSGR
jgi:hypothetical protein